MVVWNWKIVTGQVSGESQNGEVAYTEDIPLVNAWEKFKPGQPAFVVICGFSFDFKSGHHPIFKQSVYLQEAHLGQWDYANRAIVLPDGTIKARFAAQIGSEGLDNPFKFKVHYAVIGMEQ